MYNKQSRNKSSINQLNWNVTVCTVH